MEGLTFGSSLERGNYAWVESRDASSGEEGSLYLVDRWGTRINERAPWFGRSEFLWFWPSKSNAPLQVWANHDDELWLLEVQAGVRAGRLSITRQTIKNVEWEQNGSTIGIFPFSTGRRAWLTDSTGLYWIDADRPNPRHRTLVKPGKFPDVTPSKDGQRIWFFIRDTPGVYAADGNGLRTEQPYLPQVVPSTIVPLRNDAAWVMAATLNRSSKGWVYNIQDIHWLSSDGRATAISSLSPRLASIGWAGFTDDERIWLTPKNGERGVVVIRAVANGPVLERHLLEDQEISQISLSLDGSTAWAVSSDRKRIFLLSASGVEQEVRVTSRTSDNVQAVSSTNDGRGAWVVFDEPLTHRQQIAFVRPGSGAEAGATAEFPEPIVQVVPIPHSSFALVRTMNNPHSFGEKESIFIVDSTTRILNDGRPLLSGIKLRTEIDGQQVWIFGTPDQVDSDKDTYLIRGQAPIAEAVIEFEAGERLSYFQVPSDPLEEEYAVNLAGSIRSAKVELKSGSSSTSITTGSVQLLLIDIKSSETHSSSALHSVQSGDPIQLNWRPQVDERYKLVLRYVSPAGGEAWLEWPNVLFRPPILSRAWMRTLIVYAAIVLGTAFLLLSDLLGTAFRKWLPLAVWASSAGFSTRQGISEYVGMDGALLMWLLMGSVLALTLASVVSTNVFRGLVQIQPFGYIAPLFLTLRALRKKYYGTYIQELATRIDDAREAAKGETYVPLPADFITNGDRIVRKERPADDLAVQLRNESRQGMAILISAAGGCGKSALLREAVSKTCAAAIRGSVEAIPVFCEWREEDSQLDTAALMLESIVARALGRSLYVPSALSTALKAGEYIIILDGLSEQSIPPSVIGDWLASEYAVSSVFLLTSRPDYKYEEGLRRAPAWQLVRPVPLNDSTLDTFESSYIEADSKRSDRMPARMSPELRVACRTRDGTYLPILVRLAVGVGGVGARTIREVYDVTVNALLERSGYPNIVDELRQLCLDTYWQSGVRSLAFEGTGGSRHALMDALWKSGLLVPAGPSNSFRKQPEYLVFFHDSIQSFVTAQALDARYRHSDDWRFLKEAAGSPKMLKAASELFQGSGSEVFHFCLLVLDKERLLEELASQLRRWSKEYGFDVTKNNVIEAAPQDAASLVELFESHETSAGTLLDRCIEICVAQSDPLEKLTKLYSALAPIVWRIEAAKQPRE